MRNILRLSLRLLLICAVASFLLGVTNAITKGPIEEQKLLQDEANRKASYPQADTFEEVDTSKLDSIQQSVGSEVQNVYLTKTGGEESGVIVALTVKGDQGPIELMIGVTKEGEVTGVSIGEHDETPGLGANMTKDSFRNQFIGKSGNVELTKFGGDIDGISGATHSSSAVVLAVNLALATAEAYFA